MFYPYSLGIIDWVKYSVELGINLLKPVTVTSMIERYVNIRTTVICLFSVQPILFDIKDNGCFERPKVTYNNYEMNDYILPTQQHILLVYCLPGNEDMHSNLPMTWTLQMAHVSHSTSQDHIATAFHFFNVNNFSSFDFSSPLLFMFLSKFSSLAISRSCFKIT